MVRTAHKLTLLVQRVWQQSPPVSADECAQTGAWFQWNTLAMGTKACCGFVAVLWLPSGCFGLRYKPKWAMSWGTQSMRPGLGCDELLVWGCWEQPAQASSSSSPLLPLSSLSHGFVAWSWATILCGRIHVWGPTGWPWLLNTGDCCWSTTQGPSS